MSTRSHTYFYQDGTPFAAFYRHMDGYPEGHGVELGKILAPIELVNGIAMGEKAGTHANGAGCLAAQVVAKMKVGIGGIYLVNPDPEENNNGWQEYEYHIHVNSTEFGSKMTVVVTDTKKVIFRGSAPDLLEWAKNPKFDEEKGYIPVIIIDDDKTPEKEDLRHLLNEKVVEVYFTKADGTRRIMRATLNMDYVPHDKKGENTKPNTDPNLFRVWDVDKKDWRSFKRDRVISYECEK